MLRLGLALRMLTPGPPGRLELLGIPVDVVTTDEVVNQVREALGEGRGGRIVTPNLDILRVGVKDAEAGRLLVEADLSLADGMPLVWASRLLGRPLPERVAGSSLALPLVEMAAKAGVGVFLLGGNPGVAERAAGRLEERWPSLRTGWHFPPFGFEADPAAMAEIRARVVDFGPCLCLVGLGFPRQDRLGAQLLREAPHSWFVGCGATLDFIAGERVRAPRWMQQAGIEWMFRLVQEPRRLARRYLIDGLPFSLRLLLWTVRERRRQRSG